MRLSRPIREKTIIHSDAAGGCSPAGVCHAWHDARGWQFRLGGNYGHAILHDVYRAESDCGPVDRFAGCHRRSSMPRSSPSVSEPLPERSDQRYGAYIRRNRDCRTAGARRPDRQNGHNRVRHQRHKAIGRKAAHDCCGNPTRQHPQFGDAAWASTGGTVTTRYFASISAILVRR